MASYSYGTVEAARSPVALEELRLLERTVMLGDDDERFLALAGDVLADRSTT
jgi:hypothetical protein